MNQKAIIILSILLAIMLSIVSYYGAFVSDTYQRDTASLAAQGIGQDIFDLFIVTPLLLLSLISLLKKSRIALYLFSGTIFYILYSFFIYCFGVHFNHLFLLYCMILGSSFYLFILATSRLKALHVQEGFDHKIPTRTLGIYLIIIASMFYMLWLKDILPAIIHYSVPKSVSDYQLLVNPVHVLDIALVLPGLIITGVSLIRKRPTGLILTPIFLIFFILLAIALVAMVIMSKVKGISEDLSIAVIFMILALSSGIFLYKFLNSN